MIIKFLVSFGLLWGLLATPEAKAHPVAYAGSYSLMTWNNADMSEWMLSYSFTSNYSLGGKYVRLETKEGERTFYVPQLTFLLKRWNELASQGNLYLALGHGTEVVERDGSKKTQSASVLSLDADWESRKYYVSFKHEATLDHRNSARNIYATKLRAGFAPYLAEFDELNGWFILQVDSSNKSKKDYMLTPLIRLFYKNILLEFGSSMKGDSQLNFMVHF